MEWNSFTLKETRNVLFQAVLSQSLHFKFLFPILLYSVQRKSRFQVINLKIFYIVNKELDLDGSGYHENK